jgi:hypothetical protein
MPDSVDTRAAQYAQRPLAGLTVLSIGSALDPPARGIIVDTEGLYGLEMTDGGTPTVHLAAGTVHPLVVSKLLTAVGSVWGGV